MSRLASLAATAVLVAWTGTASGYSTITNPASRWVRDWGTTGVSWVMNADGCPDMPFDQALAALQASFQTWEDVDCAVIGFVYEGSTPQTTTTTDGVNLMVWRTSGWPYGSGALGVTQTWFGGGIITDADIEFNSVNYTWSETGSGRTIDLESVATHEVGHLLGLGHTEDPAAVMFPTYSGGTAQRFLGADDVAGICFLYPSATGGCTTNDECPPGHECRGRDCVPASTGEVCALCGGHEDCGGPADSCVRYPDGSYRCGRACRSAEDCATVPGCGARACDCMAMSGGGGMQCAPVDLDCSEGPQCTVDEHCPDGFECVGERCVPRGCSALGAACETRGDCCSSVCIDQICSQPCDWLDPRGSCPDGFYCAIQECGVGTCMPGSLGSARRGEACAAHEECAGGYCASTGGPTTCGTPCDPDGIDTCPDDWSCQRIGASRCGLCACRIGLIGDPCGEAGQCANGVCATKSGERRCSRFCGAGDPCPGGYDCLDAGPRSICWPARGGLGSSCASDDDCSGDGLCRRGLCTRSCENDCSCAVGYDCAEVDGGLVCVLAPDRGGCDCAAAGSGARPAAAGLAALLLAVLAVTRRRA